MACSACYSEYNSRFPGMVLFSLESPSPTARPEFRWEKSVECLTEKMHKIIRLLTHQGPNKLKLHSVYAVTQPSKLSAEGCQALNSEVTISRPLSLGALVPMPTSTKTAHVPSSNKHNPFLLLWLLQQKLPALTTAYLCSQEPAFLLSKTLTG